MKTTKNKNNHTNNIISFKKYKEKREQEQRLKEALDALNNPSKPMELVEIEPNSPLYQEFFKGFGDNSDLEEMFENGEFIEVLVDPEIADQLKKQSENEDEED